MKKISIVLVLVSVLIAPLYYLIWKMPKVGYVNNSLLITRFEATTEVNKAIDSLKIKLKKDEDTLKDSLFSVMGLAKNKQGLSKQAQEKLMKRVQFLNMGVLNLKKNHKERLGEAQAKLMLPVMSKIDAFVKMYVHREGYDVLVGTGSAGGVLLSMSEDVDLTEVLVSEMNQYYGYRVSEKE